MLLTLIILFLGENFSLNAQSFLLINGSQSTTVNPFMIVLAEYGREYFWIPITILLWILGRETQKKAAFLLALSFILAIILGEISKIAIGAPRPDQILPTAKILVTGESDPSFPSGHAVIVSTGALLALIRLSRKLALPLTLEALLVSYSRIYVGVHWPIDIIAGWSLGGFCAVLMLVQENRFEPAYKFLLNIWTKLVNR